MHAYAEVHRTRQNLKTFQERATFWREHGHVGNAMAARGAMLIYDFYRVQQRIQSLAPKSAALDIKVDREKLKLSNVAFKQQFPNFVKLRHAAAHAAEHVLSDEFVNQAPEDNNIKGMNFGVPVLMAGTIVNDNYVWTIDNQHVSYEVSARSAEVLLTCSALIHEAYKSLR